MRAANDSHLRGTIYYETILSAILYGTVGWSVGRSVGQLDFSALIATLNYFGIEGLVRSIFSCRQAHSSPAFHSKISAKRIE